jgi:dihydroorotase-like cyclic amidohydrolase
MIEVDLEIKNGRVITADGEFSGSVYIESGKIAGLGDLDLRAQHSVDASGLLVMPGMFESHAHLMDPAETAREEMSTGADADIVLVDPDAEYEMTDEMVISKAGWTPYAGRIFRGRTKAVYLRGKKIAEDGTCLAKPGTGEFMARQRSS